MSFDQIHNAETVAAISVVRSTIDDWKRSYDSFDYDGVSMPEAIVIALRDAGLHAEYGRLVGAAKVILKNYRGVGPVGNCEVDVWDLDELRDALAALGIDGSQGGAMTAEFVPTWERPVTTWTDAELRGVGCAAHEDYVSEEILRSDVRRLVAEVQRLRQVVSEFDGCDAPPPGRSHVRCDWEKGHVGAHMWVQRIDGPDA